MTTKHKFRKGYKQYRVMDRMQEFNGLSYTEITQFAYELNYGPGTFDKVRNRGYWSGPFVQKFTGMWGSDHDGWITKYCDKGRDGLYRVNGNGLRKLNELSEKFESISVEEAAMSKRIEDKIKENVEKDVDEKVDAFKEKYKKQLDNFKKRNIPPKMNIDNPPLSPRPKLRLRGLQLDNSVAYRRTSDNESGVGYISMVKVYSKDISNDDELHIAIEGAVIPVSYNEEEDKFYNDYKVIEIIKL